MGLGQFPPHAGKFANPHDGLTANGAAEDFDGVSVRRGQAQQKPFAAFAQGVDRVIHLQRRRPRQPGSERQDALGRFLGGQRRDITADLGPVFARGPRNQDLGFGKQQCAVAVGLVLQVLDFTAQPGLVSCRAQTRSHQQDGGDDRKAEQGQRRRERRELLMVDTDEVKERRVGRMGGLGQSESARADKNCWGCPSAACERGARQQGPAQRRDHA